MPVARNCTGFGWVVRNSCRLEYFRRFAAVPHPNRKNGFGKNSIGRVSTNRFRDGRSSIRRRSKRCRHIHDHDGIVLIVGQKRLKSRGVARRVRISGNIDRIGPGPDRRQRCVELGHGPRPYSREQIAFLAEVHETIDGKNADTASVRQNRQPFPGKAFDVAQSFSGRK